MTTEEFLISLIENNDDPYVFLKDLEEDAAKLAETHILPKGLLYYEDYVILLPYKTFKFGDIVQIRDCFTQGTSRNLVIEDKLGNRGYMWLSDFQQHAISLEKFKNLSEQLS